MRKLIFVAMLLAVCASVNAAGSDETQIWNLEKAYWDYVKANDLEKYRALWHEDFLGWPFVSPQPVGKDRYYRVSINWSNSTGGEATNTKIRVTHTWLRTNDTWVIVGGMSAPVNEHGQ